MFFEKDVEALLAKQETAMPTTTTADSDRNCVLRKQI